MSLTDTTYFQKLCHNLPWLAGYPFNRAANFFGEKSGGEKHVIITIANHFEPAWSANGILPIDAQRRRLDEYYKLARATGEAVRDADGTKFRHTNFYPAEQYDRKILDTMAAMQAEGLGEVEIHLHHGVEKPDTAENLRKSLVEFRDVLAEEHQCLSLSANDSQPKYAFVHGNLALANSANGKCCGVDNEMRILAETGCYIDLTLPSAPVESQVAVINKIYECGLPLNEPAPHRKGKSVEVGSEPQLPVIFTGPLVFNWKRRVKGLPVPRIEDGALTENQPLDAARFRRWTNANVTVKNRPEWIFVKLYCHGFFDYDQSACIGERARRFFGELVETGAKTGAYKIHFATAREAANLIFAATDGKSGDPREFRDYRWRTIMNQNPAGKKTEIPERLEVFQQQR